MALDELAHKQSIAKASLASKVQHAKRVLVDVDRWYISQYTDFY